MKRFKYPKQKLTPDSAREILHKLGWTHVSVRLSPYRDGNLHIAGVSPTLGYMRFVTSLDIDCLIRTSKRELNSYHKRLSRTFIASKLRNKYQQD